MIQPNYGVISCAKILKRQSKVRVEGIFNELEDVKKPISVFAKPFIVANEEKDEKTIIKAKVVFTLVYLSDDGYKKATCECDASTELDGVCRLIDCFAFDVKLLTGNGYSGVASIVFTGQTVRSDERAILQTSDGIISKLKEIDVDLYYNESKGEQLISDEFTLDFTVGEVLFYNAIAYLTRVNCGLGKIILEGESVLTVKALPFSENNDIVKETRVIPFRYELESDDALPDMKVLAKVSVLSTNVKIFADENKQKSSVSVDIKLAFASLLVSEERVTVIEDAYLKSYESNLKTVQIEKSCFKEQRRFREKVVCLGEPAIDGGRILTVLGESVNIISVKAEGETVSVDGILKVDVVFKNADNGIVCVPCERPFTFDFTADGEAFDLTAEINGVNARVRNGEIEIEAYLEVCYNLFTVENIVCVEEIIENGERMALGSAISVFVASSGDELWDVAKRLGASEEEILKYNGDLVFPLDGNERIILYRQKL